MNFTGINYESLADGEGVRVSLFVSGCGHHCPGCFNQEAWDYNAGELFGEETLEALKRALSKDYISGLTMLGGEPLDSFNLLETYYAVRTAKNLGKNVWVYTGYTWEQLLKRNPPYADCLLNILKYTDVLVDGPFIEEQRDISLPFRGSSNQRIIDVQKSIDAGKVILYELHN